MVDHCAGSLLLLVAGGFIWTPDEKPCSILMSPKFSFLSYLRGRWKLSAEALLGKGNLLWCYLLLNLPHLSLLSDHSWVRSLCHVFRPPGSFTSPQSQSKLFKINCSSSCVCVCAHACTHVLACSHNWHI